MKKGYIIIGNILCVPVGIYILYVLVANLDFDIWLLGSLLAFAFIGLIIFAIGAQKKKDLR